MTVQATEVKCDQVWTESGAHGFSGEAVLFPVVFSWVRDLSLKSDGTLLPWWLSLNLVVMSGLFVVAIVAKL